MTTAERDDEAMLIARALVEQHIYHYGMVPHPDFIKDAIAKSLRTAAKVTEARGVTEEESGWQLVPVTLTEPMRRALDGTHLKQPQYAQLLWNEVLRAAMIRGEGK